MKLWQWDPIKYIPRYIAGPDITMKNSAYIEVLKARTMELFTANTTEKTNDTTKPDTIICPFMNNIQKKEFLLFHSARYGYKIKSPDRYINLVTSFESIAFIYCMDELNLIPEQIFFKKINRSIKYEFLARNKFPHQLLNLLSSVIK